MTRLRTLNIVAATAACVLICGPDAVRTSAQEPQQIPTFRSSASAVVVDASVRDRNRRPVTNLKPADFEIQDNGVPQTVDNLSYGKLPIDVTVALDVSFSVTGVLLERLRRGVVQLMDDLGKEDRLKLMLFNNRVTRTVDFTSDVKEVERAMKTAAAGGSTALLDAVSVALVSSNPSSDRRQLVVFFTDGSDSTSAITPATLTTTARRARATVTFVMPSAGTISVFSQTSTGSRIGLSEVMTSIAMPARADTVYSTVARETGGSILPVSASTDLAAAFRQVLGEFRSAYVLYYNATGVERGGYHTLDVKVKRENTTVQARRGYWY